jgi:hypothetical protein
MFASPHLVSRPEVTEWLDPEIDIDELDDDRA